MTNGLGGGWRQKTRWGGPWMWMFLLTVMTTGLGSLMTLTRTQITWQDQAPCMKSPVMTMRRWAAWCWQRTSPSPLPSAQGASQQHKRVGSDPAAEERPTKKARAEWTWTPADLPNRASQEHKFTVKGIFFSCILTKSDRLYVKSRIWQAIEQTAWECDNTLLVSSKILLVRYTAVCQNAL